MIFDFVVENGLILLIASLTYAAVEAAATPKAWMLGWMLDTALTFVAVSLLEPWYEGINPKTKGKRLGWVDLWNGVCFYMVWGTITFVFRDTYSLMEESSPWTTLPKACAWVTVTQVYAHAYHRATHTPLLWRFHRKHHTHVYPFLGTNVVFSVVEMAMLAVTGRLLPYWTLSACGVGFTSFDILLPECYNIWLSIVIHSEHDVPASFFPPLRPLGYLCGWSDDNAVKAHHRHHRHIRQNYGLHPWTDWAVLQAGRGLGLSSDAAGARTN